MANTERTFIMIKPDGVHRYLCLELLLYVQEEVTYLILHGNLL